MVTPGYSAAMTGRDGWNIHAGFSTDGVNWWIKPHTTDFVRADAEVGKLEYRRASSLQCDE
jgi:hypothetical protein